jgi:hypothetical protein
MRKLLITVLLVFAVGACNLVFDSKSSTTEQAPDAGTTDDPQHDGGVGPTGDGGCNELPPDAGSGYYPDAGGWPDGGSWPSDGGSAPDAGQLWPDGGP